MSRKTSPFLTLLLLSALVIPAKTQGQNARTNTGVQAPQQRQTLRAANAQQRPGLTQRGGAVGQQPQAPAGQRVQTPAGQRAQTPASVRAPGSGGAAAATPQKESCVLRSSHRVGSADVVEVTMEASGEVLQTNAEGKTERAAMEVVAGFKYEERFEDYSPSGQLRTIRRYEQAGLKRKLGASVVRPLLDSSRKYVVSEFDGKKTRMYSTGGPMKDEQYALVSELPFNTTILDRLLPNREVKLGEDWQLPNELVVALLGVDAIENNTLHLTLTSVSDSFAEVELYQIGEKDAQGNETPSTLACASEGASLGLDLEGKFQFDLKANRITWFGVNIDERRSESVATPGLKWSATIKINIAPLEAPEKLTDDVIAPFKSPTPEQLMLYYNAHRGPWKFQHSRKWKLIEDGDKITSMCYLDGGEAVAQCNIISNGKIELDSKPTINGYKEEIQKGLGERFAEFKQEASYEGPGEVSIYYVVADGSYDELPFRWIYYLITDKEGNQATIMFELRADLIDKYDDSGNEIVESFRLVPRSTSGLRETLENAESAKSDATPKASGINATK